MKKRAFLSAVALTALITGCGVNKAQLDKASERLDKLTGSGLPDSLLIEAKAQLYDAKQADQNGQGSVASDCYKQAISAMKQAESILAKSLTEKKPQVVSKLAELQASSKNELKGLHQSAMNTVLDSVSKLISKDWILEAEKQESVADSLFAKLKVQQGQADQLYSTAAGTWNFEKHITSSVDYTVNATENKIFTLLPDGKATYVEQKVGKSSHTLKEDYRFESYGTWDIKGDTIHIKTSRFVCAKQNFEEQHEVDGKTVWKKNSKPTYDSAITDGSQDRYIAYTNLTQDFKKQ